MAADVSDKFRKPATIMRIHLICWCICNHYDFTMPISSKCCCICYRLAVIYRGFGDPHFRRGVRGVLWVRSCINRKPTNDFLIPLNPKVCSICRHLAGTPMPNMAPNSISPFGGLGWTQGVENCSNQNVVSTFLCDFYTHYRPNLHRLGTIHNAVTDTQKNRYIDRAIGIGRICYSIGGPKRQFISIQNPRCISGCTCYLSTWYNLWKRQLLQMTISITGIWQVWKQMRTRSPP